MKKSSLLTAGTLISFFFLSWVASANDRQTLEGYWASACYSGKLAEMRIQNSKSYLREAFYKETNCKTPLFFIETFGAIQYPEAETATANTSFFPVDYTYENILLTPLTEEMAQQFNESELCGITHWSVLIPQTIAGRRCRMMSGARPISIPSPGQQRFGIFKVVEPWLYFGQNNPLEDSSTPARRPKDLQAEPFGKRL